MKSKWIKPRKLLVAIGVIVVSWATLQNEGVASGEFLTDRIGEGSVLQIAAQVRSEFNGHAVYFQDGRPVNLTQIKVERPYCKLASTQSSLAQSVGQDPRLVVKFKNVARARWFFDHGVELECMAPRDHEIIRETDFHNALGDNFQVEKHSNSHPERFQWNGSGAV